MKKETIKLIEKIKEGENNPDFQVTKMSIFNLQVCSSKTEDEVLKWAREFSPAGTEGNWQKTEDVKLRPVVCAENSSRKHYVFEC